MKLWVFSDLHLDVNRRYPYTLPQPHPAHDAVIIAGDLCQGVAEGVQWIAASGLAAKPVLYVTGNHEYYGRDRHADLAAGRTEAGAHPNIHLLERDRVVIDGVAFHGCTLWTDYLYFGRSEQARAMQHATQRLNDHRLIAAGGGRWLPRHCLEEHRAGRAWLEQQLRSFPAGPSVVVSHHAPSRRSVKASYQDDLLTAAFASDLDELAAGATLWVHGHVHNPVDARIGSARVLANPRGYVGIGEDRAFDPALVIEIP